MQSGFYLIKESILFLIDVAGMPEESYDLLDRMEEQRAIDKLTKEQINSLIFYQSESGLRVALSHKRVETYRTKLNGTFPYIRL